VAYLGASHHIAELRGKLCALLTEEDRDQQREPVTDRVYRTLVKWTPKAAKALNLMCHYGFIDLKISSTPGGYALVAADSQIRSEFGRKLSAISCYNDKSKDLRGVLDFALAGKPVIQNGMELSLSNLIDRFQDVRHVFNLPTVPCQGMFRGQNVANLNLGEFQLFSNLNERRAALQSAVLIGLDVEDHVTTNWEAVRDVLLSRHFREVGDSPSRRGHFRRYPNSDWVEIYFPHNVYPFGVIGLSSEDLVCLASGGLSGRVGNTLEGITRIMYDFFGCEDAMVLDEGYDTFQLVNPMLSEGGYKYTNEQVEQAVLHFTYDMLQKEMGSCPPHENLPMRDWELNRSVIGEVERVFKSLKVRAAVPSDIIVVRPHRSQMRSVIIFAIEKHRTGGRARQSPRCK
jgi:hypothetical protein